MLAAFHRLFKVGWLAAYGTGIVQRERPVVQGPGLHGKERKSFVARANLLNRPLRTRTVGGVGGDG